MTTLRRGTTRHLFGLLLLSACGFGPDNDTGNPEPASWWSWVCANGNTPFAASAASSYAATGTCGTGGAFKLSVDGCDMNGNWDTLDLTAVQTVQPVSPPSQGTWIVSGNVGTAATAATCTSGAPTATGTLVVSCVDDTGATLCVESLTPTD